MNRRSYRYVVKSQEYTFGFLLPFSLFPDRFDFLLSFYFSIPLFNNRTKLGSGISYGIMTEMLLEDLLILSLISLVCTVS